MHLIQIYLPLQDNEGKTFETGKFSGIEKELTERFGGLTAFTRAPADGFWKPDRKGIQQDRIVIFEVIAAQLDQKWWEAYRHNLEEIFSQDEIMVLATEVSRL